MHAERNEAIAYERRQWNQLSQTSGWEGGFFGIAMATLGKKN